jgi:hypothetical protein
MKGVYLRQLLQEVPLARLPSALESILVTGGIKSKAATRFERLLDGNPIMGITADSLAHAIFAYAEASCTQCRCKALALAAMERASLEDQTLPLFE